MWRFCVHQKNLLVTVGSSLGVTHWKGIGLAKMFHESLMAHLEHFWIHLNVFFVLFVFVISVSFLFFFCRSLFVLFFFGIFWEDL